MPPLSDWEDRTISYATWSVSAGEQPTPAKWNILGTNDSSFNDGTGIANSAILTRHLATSAVDSTKFKPTFFNINSDLEQSVTNTGADTDLTGITYTFTPAVASLAFVVATGYITFGTNAPSWSMNTRLRVDGSQVDNRVVAKSSAAGISYVGGFSMSNVISLSAAPHTIKLTGFPDNALGATYNEVSLAIVVFSNA